MFKGVKRDAVFNIRIIYMPQKKPGKDAIVHHILLGPLK